MKNKWMTLFTATAVSMLSFTAVNTSAKVKKNDPDKKEVEKILKEIGGEHYVDKMKVSSLCSMEMENNGEEIYYHIYNVSLREGGYRIVIFDNTPNYLGFYPTDFEPTDYEEGAVLLDSGDSDEEGNTSYFNLPIPAKGPSDKVRIDGVPKTFVKNPKLEKKAGTLTTDSTGALVVPKVKTASGVEIDYRDWKITIQGKERVYNAIFVAKDGSSKITIKDSKRGATATIPVSALSADDVEYLKGIGEL